ncbi:MAG TPA: nucleotide exchange factor GrpE [Casimicrobiaceae bacterium]|jgi:molecular chaperone GrpE
MTPQDPKTAGLPVEAESPHRDPAPTGDPAPDIDALLRKAEDEATQLKDAWLRALAESENTRRQAQQDVARATKFAIEKFATDLLPVKDALEKALATGNVTVDTLRAGTELTLKNLQSALSRANVQDIGPQPGDKFDPHRHEAVQMVPSDAPANTIVTVYQKGYVLNDRVLRPAMVTVSSGTQR